MLRTWTFCNKWGYVGSFKHSITIWLALECFVLRTWTFCNKWDYIRLGKGPHPQIQRNLSLSFSFNYIPIWFIIGEKKPQAMVFKENPNFFAEVINQLPQNPPSKISLFLRAIHQTDPCPWPLFFDLFFKWKRSMALWVTLLLKKINSTSDNFV